MYRLLYGLLYLYSLLPFWLLYIKSDVLFFFLYHVLGYRKKIVRENLLIAFPEKSEAERKTIEKQFFKNLTDSFFETIKLLSISDDELRKHIEMPFDQVNAVAAKGKNIQVHCGHQMNWEWGNRLLAMNSAIPLIGIYKKIENKATEKLFQDIRRHQNLTLIALEDFGPRTQKSAPQPHLLGLIADQNPNPAKSYWINFFNKPAPFFPGPEKSARLFNNAVVFVNFIRKGRGKFFIEAKVITENAREFEEGQLTLMFRDFLEAGIRNDPANYLWSHRRWRRKFTQHNTKQWIDGPMPDVEAI